MSDGLTEAWKNIKPYKPKERPMKSVKITFKDNTETTFNDVISHQVTDTHVNISYSDGNVGIFNINEIKSIEFAEVPPKQILHG